VRQWQRADAGSTAHEMLWCALGSLVGAAACVAFGGLMLFP
jgi:hypothetical protein